MVGRPGDMGWCIVMSCGVQSVISPSHPIPSQPAHATRRAVDRGCGSKQKRRQPFETFETSRDAMDAVGWNVSPLASDRCMNPPGHGDPSAANDRSPRSSGARGDRRRRTAVVRQRLSPSCQLPRPLAQRRRHRGNLYTRALWPSHQRETLCIGPNRRDVDRRGKARLLWLARATLAVAARHDRARYRLKVPGRGCAVHCSAREGKADFQVVSATAANAFAVSRMDSWTGAGRKGSQAGAD